jgi:hypothetical protein
MSDLVKRYDIPPEMVRRGKRLKLAAWTAPPVLAIVPAVLFILLGMILSGTALMPLTVFLGILLPIVGFVVGLGLSGFFAYRHSQWTAEMRERIAAYGIKAEELSWFRNELTSNEKRALKAVENADELLADAYRDTLASRLTATRIIRSSKRELQASKRRQQKLKQLRSESSKTFRDEIEKDITNISRIHSEAKEMLSEAESRLQMIEAAASRGSSIEGNRVALEKLALRSSELPHALNEALRTEEIRKSVERELIETDAKADDPGRGLPAGSLESKD